MRAGTLLALALLLASCTGAPPASPATPSPASEPVRVLASGLWHSVGDHYSVDAATDEPELELLWQELGQRPPLPTVDFERELVLFLGMSGSSSCPERFERLVVDANMRVYAEWSPAAAEACTDDLAPQGLLLSVDRSQLPDEPFLVSLREEPICPDCAAHPDQVLVDPR